MRSASGSSLAPVGFMTCNVTLGNKTFQHDFVVCKHLMRPLILGREFLFENELKVYYSKTDECRLDYKQEELIATFETQDELTLSLKSGVYIPGRTVAVLNVDSSVQQYDVGQVYNVRAISLLEYETLNYKLFQPYIFSRRYKSQFSSFCDGKPGRRSHLLI